MSETPHFQEIDLKILNLQQLTSLKQQFDLNLGILQDSLQTLKIAQTKFQESGLCLEKITPAMEGEFRINSIYSENTR